MQRCTDFQFIILRKARPRTDVFQHTRQITAAILRFNHSVKVRRTGEQLARKTTDCGNDAACVFRICRLALANELCRILYTDGAGARHGRRIDKVLHGMKPKGGQQAFGMPLKIVIDPVQPGNSTNRTNAQF